MGRCTTATVLELYIKFGSNIRDRHWDQHTYAPDIHLMTSRELTSGFDFWSAGHFRMAVVHLLINFGVDICIQSRVIDIFRNPRRRPPPSWIFKSCKFGTFVTYYMGRCTTATVLELYIKFGSNIRDSHWDQHTYAPDIHLMTSRELTSGFDFWSAGHLRTAVVHLPINFGVDIPVQSYRPSPLLWPVAYTTACTTVQAVMSQAFALGFCEAMHCL